MWNQPVSNAPFNANPGFASNPPFGGNAPQPTGFNPGFSSNPSFSQPSFATQPKPFGNPGNSFSQGTSLFNPNPQPSTSWGAQSGFPSSTQPGQFNSVPNSFNPNPSGFMANSFANPSFNANPAPNPTGFNSGFMSNPIGVSNPTPGAFSNNPGFSAPNTFTNAPSFSNNPGFSNAANTFNPGNSTFNTSPFNSNPPPTFSTAPAFNSAPPSTGFNSGSMFTSGFPSNNTFNSNPGFGPQQGTLKFKPTQIREDTSNITVQNLCAMPEATNKSIEEVRFQDYKARPMNPVSNFSNPVSNPSNIGLAPSNTGSLFLNSNPLASSQPNSLFNKPPENKPSLFNNSGPSLFSNNNQATNSLFPSTSTPSLFPSANNNNSGTQPLNLSTTNSLFNNSGPSLFNTTQVPNNNLNPTGSLFTSNTQPGSLFPSASPGANSLFNAKPQNNNFTNQSQQSDNLRNAYKDPHGLSWLFPEVVPENVIKSYNQRVSTQLSAEPMSVVERIVKPKKISNYPQVISEKWKNSQEKKYLKTSSSFDFINQKKTEPFFVAKRPSFVNLKLEEYKDEDNSRYFKMPGQTPKRFENVSEILVVAHDPNPIRMVIPITANTSIKEIKYQVSRHLPDTDEDSLQLVYKSKILQNTDTVKNLGISHGDEFSVINIPIQHHTEKEYPSDEMLPVVAQGYKLKPSISEMARMTVDDLRKVKNLTIENQFGKIVFEGETNVLGVNISDIIKINHKEIIGYPDDCETEKPRIGEGLNKACVATLFRYEMQGNKEKNEQKIKNVCLKCGMEFLSYDQESQELTVKLKHF